MTNMEFLNSLETIYSDLEEEIADLTNRTGLHCRNGCGLCCQRPSREIEATVLEMIPAALAISENIKAFDPEVVWTEACEAGAEGRCVLYLDSVPGGFQGNCGLYGQRPLVCRLFGYAARKNKENTLEVTFSQPMKEDSPQMISKVKEDVASGGRVPVYSDYRFRIDGVDPGLTGTAYPLNTALVKALEWVSLRRRLGAP